MTSTKSHRAESCHFFAILLSLSLILSASVSSSTTTAADESGPILVGLDADMSGGAALSGNAIKRGASLAIAEINKSGGVLGRKLQLVVRDHRGNPSRGLDNILEFAEMDDLVAVVGGIHTPVALYELKAIHEHKIVYLGAWAAGTPVVENGFNPNYVFRVSVRDADAGPFLVSAAVSRGAEKIGLLLEKTGWGKSNHKAMTGAIEKEKSSLAGVEWFNWGEKDLTEAILRLKGKGTDVLLLVANPREAEVLIRNMSMLPESQRIPIISHWGITGGNFGNTAKQYLPKVDLVFLQTFSFFEPPFPEKSKALQSAYLDAYPDVKSAREIPAPVGVAHAYDLIHLLKLAIIKADGIDRKKVRDALEQLPTYQGVMKKYAPAFTTEKHDALTAENFQLAKFDEMGHIIPLSVE